MTINDLNIPYDDFEPGGAILSEEFDDNNATIQEKVNEIILWVNNIIEGSSEENISGAQYISTNPIEGVSGNNVQSMLQSLKELLDNLKEYIDEELGDFSEELNDVISTLQNDVSNAISILEQSVSDEVYDMQQLLAGTIDALELLVENKVDKVPNKGLSTNDFTGAYKDKLDGIDKNANKYIHPETHPASMITDLASVATSGSYNDLINKPEEPSPYVLPKASQSILGGIKVGNNLSINGEGVLSAVADGSGEKINIVETTTTPLMSNGSHYTIPLGSVEMNGAGTRPKVGAMVILIPHVDATRESPYLHIDTKLSYAVISRPLSDGGNVFSLEQDASKTFMYAGVPILLQYREKSPYDAWNCYWQAIALTKPVAEDIWGVIDIDKGGTGRNDFYDNRLLYADTIEGKEVITQVPFPNQDGMILKQNTTGAPYWGTITIPTASSSTLGGIKVGNGLVMSEEGVLSATDSGSGEGTSIPVLEMEYSYDSEHEITTYTIALPEGIYTSDGFTFLGRPDETNEGYVYINDGEDNYDIVLQGEESGTTYYVTESNFLQKDLWYLFTYSAARGGFVLVNVKYPVEDNTALDTKMDKVSPVCYTSLSIFDEEEMQNVDLGMMMGLIGDVGVLGVASMSDYSSVRLMLNPKAQDDADKFCISLDDGMTTYPIYSGLNPPPSGGGTSIPTIDISGNVDEYNRSVEYILPDLGDLSITDGFMFWGRPDIKNDIDTFIMDDDENYYRIKQQSSFKEYDPYINVLPGSMQPNIWYLFIYNNIENCFFIINPSPIQSNWEQENEEAEDYIKNKPDTPNLIEHWNDFDDVAYCHKLSLYIGIGSGEKVYVSHNGLKWDLVAELENAYVNTINFVNDKIILSVSYGAASATYIVVSDDGYNWTEINTGKKFGTNIAYSEEIGLYISVHNYAIYYSTDLNTWGTYDVYGQIENFYGFKKVAAGKWDNEDVFIVVGEGNKIYSSSDGEIWTGIAPYFDEENEYKTNWNEISYDPFAEGWIVSSDKFIMYNFDTEYMPEILENINDMLEDDGFIVKELSYIKNEVEEFDSDGDIEYGFVTTIQIYQSDKNTSLILKCFVGWDEVYQEFKIQSPSILKYFRGDKSQHIVIGQYDTIIYPPMGMDIELRNIIGNLEDLLAAL